MYSDTLIEMKLEGSMTVSRELSPDRRQEEIPQELGTAGGVGSGTHRYIKQKKTTGEGGDLYEMATGRRVRARARANDSEVGIQHN